MWNFRIGGCQVCERRPKYRGVLGGGEDRQLKGDDLARDRKIVVSLSQTIRLMAEIDRVIDEQGGWPTAFRTNAST